MTARAGAAPAFRASLLPALAAGALVAAGLMPGTLGAQPVVATGVDLVVEITNMRNAKGTVRACMTSDPKVFPRCREDPASHRLVVPAGEAQVLRFRNVVPGTYAIALLHDENDNTKADRALSMIPREGFGFSRDARVRTGPPKFADAAITIDARTERQTIRMRYML